MTPGEIGAAADNRSAGLAWGDSNIHPQIMQGSQLSGNYSSIDTAGVNSFAYSAADSTGLTAVFDGGEGLVYGWLVRDRQTSVDLPADASRETIYLGYDPDASLATGEAPADSENVILGMGSAFGAGDPRIAIYDISTDGSSITDVFDRRRLYKPIEFESFERVLKVLLDGGGSRAFDINTDTGLTRAHEGFEVLGGDVTVGNLLVTSGGYIRDEVGQTTVRTGGGSDALLYDHTNSMRLLTAREGGLVRVDNGSLEVPSGLVDNAGGDGLKPPDIAGGSLPADTEPGRIVYDSSRES